MVITIVVLIILAGVAINLTLGDNGIFNKAKYAKSEYSNAKTKEKIEIEKTSNEIDQYVDGMRDKGTLKKVSLGTIEYRENISDGYGDKTIDVKKYKEYQSFTEDNFALNCNFIYAYGGASGTVNDNGVNFTMSYDKQNGILTISLPRHVRSNGCAVSVDMEVLLFYVD